MLLMASLLVGIAEGEEAQSGGRRAVDAVERRTAAPIAPAAHGLDVERPEVIAMVVVTSDTTTINARLCVGAREIAVALGGCDEADSLTPFFAMGAHARDTEAGIAARMALGLLVATDAGDGLCDLHDQARSHGSGRFRCFALCASQVFLQPLQRAVARLGNVAIHELRDPRIADARTRRNGGPIASTTLEGVPHKFIKVFAHADRVAKICYSSKQHFASHGRQTKKMSKRSINEVLAENLRHYMKSQGLKQTALGEAAGMAQTTVSLYLSPSRRQPSKSGKIPSANLGDVERLATALKVEVWELLRPLSGPEREAYDKIANAFKALQGMDGPPRPAGGGAKSKASTSSSPAAGEMVEEAHR